MGNNRQHAVHQLIQTMDASEKAYFKKFGFKRDNKNNASYVALFNLIDKSVSFEINDLKKDKKINASHMSNPHAALNNLFKIITQSMVDYRKDKSHLNKFFTLIQELDLYQEKGLKELTEKKYLQIEQFVEDKNMYYFKPYVYQKRGTKLRNDLSARSADLEKYFSKLDQAKIDLDVNVDINKISLKIEAFFHKNGGVVNKGKCSPDEVKFLLDYIDQAILKSKENFHFLSILNNNRFIVLMIFTKMEEIDKNIKKYLKEFDKNIDDKFTDGPLSDILITLKNYATVCVYLGYRDLYQEVYKRMERIMQGYRSEEYKTQLRFRLLNLQIANYALNKDIDININIIDETANLAQSVFKNKSVYSEALIICMMAYIHKGEFEKAMDISEDFVQKQHNERVRDQYISIRLLRAIVWFKKDNYDVFQSEITSIYKKLISIENFPFQLHITQMLKKLSKLSLKDKNNELINKIIQECNDVLESESGAQMMKAVEIRGIALLALS